MSIFSVFTASRKIGDKEVVGYIDCATTVQAATDMELSICDFVERLWNQKGLTAKIIENAAKHVNFSEINNVCEIGPGTGRYIKKTLERMEQVNRYAIYEIDADWANWLSKEYPVQKCNTDGFKLTSEEDNSIDFCQAHGVLVSLTMYNTLVYLKEMIRTVKPGGFIYFDYLSETSFQADIGEAIIADKVDYPNIIPSAVVKQFLESNGCKIVESFNCDYGLGKSQYILAQKSA